MNPRCQNEGVVSDASEAGRHVGCEIVETILWHKRVTPYCTSLRMINRIGWIVTIYNNRIRLGHAFWVPSIDWKLHKSLLYCNRCNTQVMLPCS